MKDTMFDGEIELSDHVLLPGRDSSSSFQGSVPADSFLDELLKNTRTCTHTHTCNPPGPDATHTHTCYHTHTQVIASEDDDDDDDNHNNKESSNSRGKRPLGNREAVRRYREKKKAHTTFLEEEVKKLHLQNQQLVRKLQGQAILEAEVMRLRGLLVDFRGKIDNELGAFPFQKQCSTAAIFKEGNCGLHSSSGTIGLRCQTDLPCFHPQAGSSQAVVGGRDNLMTPLEGNCHPALMDCQLNTNTMVNTEGHGMDPIETLASSTQAEQVE